MPLKVTDLKRDSLIASRVERASRLWARMKGLLGRKSLPAGQGLWIDACPSIHTFFMRFPIDAVFVGADLRVLRIYRGLKPFRLTRCIPGASAVLELPAGTLTDGGLAVGDRLRLEEVA
jgi:uncharacterized membrane protein (UPF0127 family)